MFFRSLQREFWSHALLQPGKWQQLVSAWPKLRKQSVKGCKIWKEQWDYEIIISGKQKVNLARGLNFLFFSLRSLTSQLYLYNAFIPFFKKREYIFVSSREGDGVTEELHNTKTNLINI